MILVKLSDTLFLNLDTIVSVERMSDGRLAIATTSPSPNDSEFTLGLKESKLLYQHLNNLAAKLYE